MISHSQIQENILRETKTLEKIKDVQKEDLFDEDNKIKEDIMEIVDKKYDYTANTRPYLLASFGSAWGCMRVGEVR